MSRGIFTWIISCDATSQAASGSGGYMVKLIDNYPFIAGFSLIILGLLLLVYQIKKKPSFKIKDHGVGSWKELVNTWAIIIFLIIWGLIIIFREV